MPELRDQDLTHFSDPIGPLRIALRGRYEIERQIGQGAFATVYLARDLKHERKVAIKVLNADPTSETGELRFIREIRTIARLQHPNILPLHDSGHVEALLYYVMPYVAGETLRDRIDRLRQLPCDLACGIARDAADALAYAHAQGVIHRDIKPENILLSAGHPIIADFGIARAIDLAGVRQLTRTGMGSPGTPAYMSPEQLLGDREIDGRSDIYSLGCVLYEMLAGKPPFAGKEGFVKRFTEPPPSVRTSRRDLPPWIDEVLATAMARNPDDRYPTAQGFVSALGTADSRPTPTSPTAPRDAAPPMPSRVSPYEPARLTPAFRSGEPRMIDVEEALAPTVTESRGWLGRLATRPRAVAVGALATVIVLVGIVLASTTTAGISRVFGVSPSIDSTRIVLLPLAGSAPERERNRITEAIYSALTDWRGLNITSDQDVRDELGDGGAPTSTRAAAALAKKLHAARFIWGQIAGADSLRGRLELYDVSSDRPLKSTSVGGSLDAAALAESTRELLEVPGRPRSADGGDGRTSSYPAWIAYGAGHIALQNGDLASAERSFRASVEADPHYGPAHVWLAQTLAWRNPAARQDWRDEIAQAMRAERGLSDKDQLVAAALSHLAERRYPQACAAYSQMTAADSVDFVGLYGLGQCHAFDSLVVRSTASASGWAFRSRYSDAANAYMKALSINPNAHAFFGFDQLQELLPVASTKTRRGKNAAGEEFAAFPALVNGATVFIPYPFSQFATLTPQQTAPAQAAAISHNLDALRDFATEWTRDAPRSSGAHMALAAVLEARGEITRSGSGNVSALQAVRKARAFASTPHENLVATTGEAWLLFKQGDYARARSVADSVFARLPEISEDDAAIVIGLAALTGKIGKLTELTRVTGYLATASPVPIQVMDAAAAYFAFAAAGVCGDTTSRLARNLDQQLAHYVAESDLAAVTTALKARPISMLAPCSGGKLSLEIKTPASRLLRMQQSLALQDSVALRRSLATITEESRTQRPGDVALDFAFQVAWLRLAAGDTVGAARQLDRALGSLSGLSAVSLREPASAAAAPRAMALRAEIAYLRGEAVERKKWARAVADLFATADAPLRPVVSRMKSLF